MQIIDKIKTLRMAIQSHRVQNKKICWVPSMGALHDGHLSLIKQAREQSDIIVATIFVNPKQFNDQEDYNKYPRMLEEDINSLKSCPPHILFIPDEIEFYPSNFSTEIKMHGLTDVLCGKSRPGHFDGIAIATAKFLNIVQPDLAILGEKDFQQLQMIRKLVEDLNFPVTVNSAPTVREANGLAMSSRNLRLSTEGRKTATAIYQTLLEIRENLLSTSKSSSGSDLQDLLNNAATQLTKLGFGKIDYFEVRQESNLGLVTNFDKNIKSRLFIAIYLEQIRLIDNLPLY